MWVSWTVLEGLSSPPGDVAPCSADQESEPLWHCLVDQLLSQSYKSGKGIEANFAIFILKTIMMIDYELHLCVKGVPREVIRTLKFSSVCLTHYEVVL